MRAVIFSCLLVGGGLARADATVAITITNDNTDDIIVTVYDMNTRPHGKLLDNQRISGFSSIPVSVAADANGNGHVSWRAVTADPDLRQCGHRDKSGLSNYDSVHVYAHSACPPPARRNAAGT